ncbi:uncharacterized protein ATNIH1004_007738 [Aspergillus tanneri]|uniref:Uncharacterized protein n=1 Tax=Aspergillus tanneri TaxID=1220188 RepID=A0A5M9MH64_9EURO|nr:uncharacterized protein ATNIH1004_007738 [Aspergillus tanneri]KAA8646311.1 hypothetical protein ATNIH1004_007738 [Aspergillus tanneri]
MSPVNPYASEPAVPVLAHSLLPQSPSAHRDKSQTWNLRDDLDVGFQSPNRTFRSGIVIGISTLRSKDNNNDDDEYVGRLPRSLLAGYLHKYPPSSPFPRAFIIHPATYDNFSPRKLLSSLLAQSHLPPLDREEAISRLDSVQLFPVFDIAAAAQALSEVSDALHRHREEQRQKPHHHQDQDQDHEHPTISSNNPDTPALLIVVGLDGLAEGTVRASNTVRGAAVLTTTLHSLTRLSRIHDSFLSVMLVNTSGLGSSSLYTNPPNKFQHRRVQRDGGAYSSVREDGIHSVFCGSESSLPLSLLMRTLDQGIDMHLLLSTVKTSTVVEVIKDRVGDGVGRWCIWDR